MFYRKAWEIGRLKKINTEQLQKIKMDKRKIQELINENKQVANRALKAITENEQLKKTVRNQTEADLLINAMKAVGIIPSKAEPEYNYFKKHEELMAVYKPTCGAGRRSLYGGLGGLGNVL